MQVVCESGITLRTQIMTDTAQSEVHLCQTVGGCFLLLSIYIDTTDVALFGFYQVGTLITAGTVGDGFVAGLIAVAAMIAAVVFIVIRSKTKMAKEYALKKNA